MKIRGFWWLGAIGVIAVLIGALLAIPVWAAPSKQVDSPVSDAYTPMHEACEVGNVQGMADGMDSLTEEDWEAMEEHMSDGHHEALGSGMMGGWSSSSGWSSMMNW